MVEAIGLRERKKQQTRDAISETAIALFLDLGFDKVSTAEVAATANVSKMTVFNYFPTKEDLVLHRFIDHFEDNATIIRDRAPDQSALDALRVHFLAGLEARDPTTGLNDQEYFLRFQDMVMSTPSLRLRVIEQISRSEDMLAETIAKQCGLGQHDVISRIAASQITAVQRTLVLENVRRLSSRTETADQVYPDAQAAANRAFDLLVNGLANVPKIGQP